MTDWDEFAVRVHPGAGLVARTSGGALFLPASSIEAPIVSQLLDLMRSAAPGGGRALARRVAAILAGATGDESFGVVLLAPLGNGDVAALVAGDVAVSAETLDGPVALSGRDSVIWVDRVLRAPSELVVTSGAGSADASAASDLLAGVVPGSGLSLTFRDRVPMVPAEAEQPREEPAPVIPSIPPVAAPAARVQLPTGVLVFDDGSLYPLEHDYVIGRQPDGAVEVMSGAARPLRLEDSGGTVSRAHALISSEEGTVRLSDHGSANGTYVSTPDNPEWQPVPPNGRVVLVPDTTIKMGNRTLRYETRSQH